MSDSREKFFTLLLADLVDSTAVNARVGDDAMAHLWDRHDDLSRELALLHNGREVDRTDGFLMLFDAPSDAVRFACDYHRGLGRLDIPIRARVGIHLGPVRLRENSEQAIARGAKPVDVLGIAKAKTARLMGLAGAGQSLVSAEVASALAGGGWRMASHGWWRLKGVDEPAEIFEVGDELAPMLPPLDVEKATRVVERDGQWVGLADVPHWLPAERDSFIGRIADLQALGSAFDDPRTRLLVLHGPGGIGKSRLAIRFAWSWLGSFPGGTYFCDLTAARGPDGILHAVAKALDVPLGAEPRLQLTSALAALGRSLVILDNFEQVAAHAQETLGRWMEAAPALRFVVTSRETLAISGERVVAVEPLASGEAAALFVARASAAGAKVDTDAYDPSVIQRLMSLLDGLPLAIELAAARSRTMTPAMLVSRMSERFSVLQRRGGLADRQATMRAVIDTSWDGLALSEQSAFAQLSVFEGGFDLAAAEAVLQVEGGDDWIPGLVQSLIEKSLVRSADPDRFAMLSVIQRYAAERLEAASPAARSAVRRHWEHYARLDDASATARRGIEIDNLVAACRRATAVGEADAAAACMLPAWAALRRVGPLGVANELSGALRRGSATASIASVVAAWIDGAARLAAGEYALARPAIEEALRIAGPALPVSLEARVRCTAGELETVIGDHGAALVHLQAAFAAATSSALPSLQCQVLNAMGTLHTERGQFDEARGSFDRALEIARQAGDLHWQGGVLGNTAVVEYARGNLAGAESALNDALRMAEDASDLRWEGNARCNLGLILLDQGKSEESLAQFEHAAEIADRVGHRTLANMVRCNSGLAHEARGDLSAACQAHRDAINGARDAGDLRGEVQFSAYLCSALARAGRLAESDELLSRALPRAVSLGDRLLLAMVLTSAAELSARRKDMEGARRRVEEAKHAAGEGPVDASTELGRRLASVEAIIRG